jgi:hypothetical protein
LGFIFDLNFGFWLKFSWENLLGKFLDHENGSDNFRIILKNKELNITLIKYIYRKNTIKKADRKF